MANERKLIDADALIKSMREEDILYPGVPWSTTGVQKQIDKLPTVDAVEVVRCRECRWSRGKDHREPTETPKLLICQCFMNHHIPAPWGARLAVDPEHFCSYGERRSDNAAD